MSGKTLLIGLDGATFTLLDPFMAQGLMPYLSGLVARGVRAPLRSVMPPLTPPGWTSLMTGKRPGQHGVFDFFQKQEPDSQYFRIADSQDIGCDTVWSLASDQGRRVTVLNYPLTFPAPAVNGCVVPGGWMPWRQLRLGCYPPGLFDRLKGLDSFNARELALDMAMEEKAIEGCAADEYAGWIALHTRRERRWLDIARYLIREEPADLIAIVFDGVDKLQHQCWRFLDPALQPANPSVWEQDVRALCDAYFRQIDEMIAELVALAGPDATVVLASDHGFGPTSDVFYLNTWLEQQGYLAWANDGPMAPVDSPRIGFSQITRHVYQLDWSRTVAYVATPSSQGIHIVRRKPGGGETMPEDAYLRLQEDLANALLRLRHPMTGRPVVEDVFTREAIFAGPYAHLAPDLSLALADGAAISILRSDTLFKRRPEPSGNHRWDGIFMASGPGIRRGAALPELSITDLAPLLLYCLELPIPEDMTGRLPVAAFEPDAIRHRPPRYVAGRAAEWNAMPPVDGAANGAADGAVYDAEAEATIVNRLRALGYVE